MIKWIYTIFRVWKNFYKLPHVERDSLLYLTTLHFILEKTGKDKEQI